MLRLGRARIKPNDKPLFDEISAMIAKASEESEGKWTGKIQQCTNCLHTASRGPVNQNQIFRVTKGEFQGKIIL